MQPRYRALRIVGAFYKILAGAVGAVTLLFAIGICGFSVVDRESEVLRPRSEVWRLMPGGISTLDVGLRTSD